VSEPRFIYVAENLDNRTLKIGCSHNPFLRVMTLRGTKKPNLWLLGYEIGSFARERSLHVQFHYARIAGEWFRDVPEIREFASQLQCGEIPMFRSDLGVHGVEAQQRFNAEVEMHMRRIPASRREAELLQPVILEEKLA
jgi:hypothetical protein